MSHNKTGRKAAKVGAAVMSAVSVLLVTSCGGGSEPDTADDAGQETAQTGAAEGGGAGETWNFQSLLPTSHFATAEEEKWAQELSAELEGSLQIEHFPSTGLGIQGSEIYTSVGSGIVDCAQMWGGHVAGTEPLAEAMDIFGLTPYDIDIRREAAEAIRPILEEEFAMDGVALLGIVQVEPRNFYTKTEVRTLDDLVGLRMRASGPTEEAFMSALGIDAVVTSDVGETLVGIDQGVYEGLVTSHDSALSAGWWEHFNYGWESQLGGAAWYLVCNEDQVSSLGEESRDYLESSALELEDRIWSAVEEAHKSGKAGLEENGIVIHTASEEDQAEMVSLMEPIWQDWVEGAGPRGEEVFNTIRSVVEEAEGR